MRYQLCKHHRLDTKIFVIYDSYTNKRSPFLSIDGLFENTKDICYTHWMGEVGETIAEAEKLEDLKLKVCYLFL